MTSEKEGERQFFKYPYCIKPLSVGSNFYGQLPNSINHRRTCICCWTVWSNQEGTTAAQDDHYYKKDFPGYRYGFDCCSRPCTVSRLPSWLLDDKNSDLAFHSYRIVIVFVW